MNWQRLPPLMNWSTFSGENNLIRSSFLFSLFLFLCQYGGAKKKKSGDIIQKRQSHGRRVDQMWKVKVKLMKYRPKCLSRTQGSLLPVPTERRAGERTWERGWEVLRKETAQNWNRVTNKRQLNYYKNKDMFRTRLNARLAIRQRAVSFEEKFFGYHVIYCFQF